MKRTYLFMLLTVLSCHFCLAQNNINIRIAKFKDDKACAISYTFDDGLKEHYTLVTPWFKKLGFKGTFVINGNVINKDEKTIKDSTRMTWGDLKEMANLGQEISNHGWAHKNFSKFTLAQIKEDIDKNDSAIYAHVGLMPRTFAYPNNTKTPDGIKIASENRVGTRLFQRSLGGKSTEKDLEDWVNKLIADCDWGVTMTHGITYGYDHFSNPNILWEHLKKIKTQEDKIWVATFKEAFSYIQERDSTVLNVTQINDKQFTINPVCKLNQRLFQEPLTIVLEEKNIRKAIITQGKNKINAIVKSNQIMFNVDTFGGLINVEIKK